MTVGLSMTKSPYRYYEVTHTISKAYLVWALDPEEALDLALDSGTDPIHTEQDFTVTLVDNKTE